jgi:hypothetical protein
MLQKARGQPRVFLLRARYSGLQRWRSLYRMITNA